MWLLRLPRTVFIETRLPGSSTSRRRRISTKHIDSSIRAFTSELVERQPVFEIPASSIRILNEPSQFYTTLLRMINQAERRIFLSSLYIGSEEGELISAISHRLRTAPGLKLELLLDLNRSTRPGKDSTANILLPLLQEFPSRVNVCMFRSPSLRGLLAKIVPPRFNEGWGTWHAKIYGADDDVMISGANLNKSYFTDRQDRYIYFSQQEPIAQYCFDFMKTVTHLSFKMLPASTTPTTLPPPTNPHSYSNGHYTLHWPNINIHPHQFNSVAQSAFSTFQKNYRLKLAQPTSNSAPSSLESVLLAPIIQAGQFNIKEEEATFQSLFRHLVQSSTKPLLDLTSGYFSLYEPYQELVLKARGISCRIVASSPKANGFYGSKGVSGRIPEGYTLYEKRFMKAVAKAGRLWNGESAKNGQGVLLSEWERPGWTYHAKGVWLSPNPSSLPILTLFGSTNLNSRSAHIDTELSFLMIIPSEQKSSSTAPAETSSTLSPLPSDSPLMSLRLDLYQEIENIRSSVVDWKGGQRNVRWTTKLIVWLVKGSQKEAYDMSTYASHAPSAPLKDFPHVPLLLVSIAHPLHISDTLF